MTDTRYYLAQVDDFGVLTVEEFEGSDSFPEILEVQVADCAHLYPSTIYFEVTREPKVVRVVLDVEVEPEHAPLDLWDWEDLVGIGTRFVRIENDSQEG